MSDNTINQIKIFGETRDFKDSWSREQIENSDGQGHEIIDDNEEYPSRRKLQFMSSDITDDDSNNATIVNFNVPKIVPKPEVIIEEYTYNGESQGPIVTGITDDMVVQNISKINAGTYTLIISLLGSSYVWNDGTTADLSYTYTISKRLVKKPTVSEITTYYYDGNIHFPNIENYEEYYVDMVGNIDPETEPGNYNIYFTLKDTENMMWTDNTASIININWIINKSDSNITFNTEDTIELKTESLYQDVIISCNGVERIINFEIDHNEVALIEVIDTYEESNITYKKIRFTFNTYGTAHVTFSVDETIHYHSDSKILTINAITIKLLNECTWEEISQVSSSGIASSCWNIGDRKAITLNGKIGDYLTLSNYTPYVYIMEFDHNAEVEGRGITFGTFKDLLVDGNDIALIDTLYGATDDVSSTITNDKKCFSINHWVSEDEYYTVPVSHIYGGWAASDIRYDILGSTDRPPSNYGSDKVYGATGQDPSSTCTSSPVSDTLMAALPSDLRAVMKPMTKWTYNGSDFSSLSGSATPTIDYLPLLGYYELGIGVTGSTSGAKDDEYQHQEVYQYFKNGNGITKKCHTTSTYTDRKAFWLRSPCGKRSPCFTLCYSNVNVTPPIDNCNGLLSIYSLQLAPIFLV